MEAHISSQHFPGCQTYMYSCALVTIADYPYLQTDVCTYCCCHCLSRPILSHASQPASQSRLPRLVVPQVFVHYTADSALSESQAVQIENKRHTALQTEAFLPQVDSTLRTCSMGLLHGSGVMYRVSVAQYESISLLSLIEACSVLVVGPSGTC